MKRVVVVAVLLVAALAWAQSVEYPAGACPVCGTDGLPVPDRDQLAKCECEKWWRGQAPARLVFADCSDRKCAEYGPNENTPLVYVDLQLYRCPKCGLLFTEPE